MRSILVGYDSSPESKLALESAYDLARATDAALRLVTVAEPPAIVVRKGGGTTAGWHALKEEHEHGARLLASAAPAVRRTAWRAPRSSEVGGPARRGGPPRPAGLG